MPGNSIAISRAIVTRAYSNERGLENKVDNLDKRLHGLGVQFVEHRAETKARFRIMLGFLIPTVVGVYAPILQNLFGG